MNKLSFITITQIISWANDTMLLNNIQFLGGSRSLPYIFRNKAYYYFKTTGREYELIMTSDRDLETY